MTLKIESTAGYLVNHTSRQCANGLQVRIVPLGIVIGQFSIASETTDLAPP